MPTSFLMIVMEKLEQTHVGFSRKKHSGLWGIGITELLRKKGNNRCKKIVSIISLLALSIVLAGCSDLGVNPGN